MPNIYVGEDVVPNSIWCKLVCQITTWCKILCQISIWCYLLCQITTWFKILCQISIGCYLLCQIATWCKILCQISIWCYLLCQIETWCKILYQISIANILNISSHGDLIISLLDNHPKLCNFYSLMWCKTLYQISKRCNLLCQIFMLVPNSIYNMVLLIVPNFNKVQSC